MPINKRYANYRKSEKVLLGGGEQAIEKQKAMGKESP